MKIVKTASGKQTIKISKKEWTSIGKKAGWMKMASSSREEVIQDMKSLLGENAFIRPSEEFDGQEGGIWFSNERDDINGLPLYDSNAETEIFADFGGQPYPYDVNPKLKDLMDKHNWFVEPYDSGTLMAWAN